jgi:hypothetical protein
VKLGNNSSIQVRLSSGWTAAVSRTMPTGGFPAVFRRFSTAVELVLGTGRKVHNLFGEEVDIMFFKGPEAGTSPPDPVLTPLSMIEAEHLVRLAERAASERGMPMTYDGDGALVTGTGLVAGLTNLARTVSGHRRRRWREIVGAHFDQVAGSLRDGPPLPPADPAAEVYLRLVSARALPPDWSGSLPEFVPGVLTVPATYADGAVAMHLEPDSLGLSGVEAVEAGIANLRALTDEVEQVEHDGAQVAALSGSMFTASRALVLDTVLRESLHVENPSYGVLVAMPTRDLLMVHIVQDDRMVPAMDLMATIATRYYVEHPGPVSPHVYYVTDGEWQQATAHVDGAVRVDVNGRMLETVRRLGFLRG